MASDPAWTNRPASPRLRDLAQKCAISIAIDMELGLSPRVRGNRRCIARTSSGRGSIPASAGEPGRSSIRPCSRRVYPRECGGTTATNGHGWSCGGLSPRVRGNRWRETAYARSVGSIPASAGEPVPRSRRPRTSGVYPRECGGTRKRIPSAVLHNGLSPRVRGNPRRGRRRPESVRSIPASAGEPGCCRIRALARWVYPRECGGTRVARGVDARDRGLSPRVRGNHAQTHPRFAILRSIPASAGEPVRVSADRHWRRVYPRECGGTSATGWLDRFNLGLSPRVRGNRDHDMAARRYHGSIPASAGNPNGGAAFWRRRGSIPASAGEPIRGVVLAPLVQVYPRECGGTGDVAGRPPGQPGLSPRVRGNPCRRIG